MKRIIIFVGITFFISVIQAQKINSTISNDSKLLQLQSHEECTIGVAIGSATADGRPMLWKTRDFISSPNNEVKYNKSYKYKFICVSDSATSTNSWMGVNEHGFAIVNSLSTDLPTNTIGPSDGTLMRDVLGNCKTVMEFQHFLDSTNTTGRSTQSNFAVIDSAGAAAIFETGGNVYYRFNADTSAHGYLIRTNFSVNGGGTGGLERYKRSSVLINNFYNGDTLNYKSILRYQMRDFSNNNSNPVSVPYNGTWANGIPYGYIYTDESICRESSVAAAVIQGVKPTEFPKLSTMWTILGQPATSVAIPYWPVGVTPADAYGANTALLCNEANSIRATLFNYSANGDYINSHKLRDSIGGGLWPCTFPLEDYIFSESQHYIDSLRLLTSLPVNSMINKEATNASYVLSQLKNCMNIITGINEVKPVSFEVSPNPATGVITIKFPQKSTMEILNIQGQTLLQQQLQQGKTNINISRLSKGVYILRLNSNEKSEVTRFVKE